MRATYILVLLFAWTTAVSLGDPFSKNDSVKTYRFISKNILTRLIDSVFEKQEVTRGDVELLNYYATILKNNNSDSVKLSDFNLSELSFYSQSDEKILFPPVSFDSLPSSFNLVLENNFLGYYFSPFKGVITSNYGFREGRLHKGIDIDLEKGDKVSAAFDGKVRFAKLQGGFGNVVILMHPNGLETVYGHLSKIKVKEGDVVLSGQTIGLGGNTGHSYGSHLHFELRYKGYPLNPAGFISFTDHKLIHHTVVIKKSNHLLAAFPSNSSLHTVNRGESWALIAGKYGLSTKELLALNGLAKRYYLKPGQQLRIN
ncbi:MAG: peptidoglycan DD-metalloendopeptidase family protein [Bacteroidetes bacterium]|nr:peptidoglycan DD-metalloendopeptidase family protein [Bacteroidota bacterium]